MLIATVPYVGKRLHLDSDSDPNPDPKLNYGSGSEHANNFRSVRIRIHNPVLQYIYFSLSKFYLPIGTSASFFSIAFRGGGGGPLTGNVSPVCGGLKVVWINMPKF